MFGLYLILYLFSLYIYKIFSQKLLSAALLSNRRHNVCVCRVMLKHFLLHKKTHKITKSHDSRFQSVLVYQIPVSIYNICIFILCSSLYEIIIVLLILVQVYLFLVAHRLKCLHKKPNLFLWFPINGYTIHTNNIRYIYAINIGICI